MPKNQNKQITCLVNAGSLLLISV